MIKMDGVQHRFDANETAYFARELESIETTIYEVKETELKYRTYIPVSNRDSEGAEAITYRMFTRVGMAKVIANYANDLPRADIYGEEFTQVVKSLGVAIGFTTQDVRAAALAGRSLDTAKAASARRSIRERESSIAWNGDQQSGLKGLIDNPNITVQAAPTGVGGFTWALKTPDEILLDVRNMVSGVRQRSKGVHNADTLLLPIAQYDIIAQTPRSATSDTTILEFIMKPGNSYGLTTVDWLPNELDSKFTAGTEDGAFCYEKNAENLELRIPMELRTYPVQEQGLEFVIPMESRIGGVVVRYPLAAVFYTGI